MATAALGMPLGQQEPSTGGCLSGSVQRAMAAWRWGGTAVLPAQLSLSLLGMSGGSYDQRQYSSLTTVHWGAVHGEG